MKILYNFCTREVGRQLMLHSPWLYLMLIMRKKTGRMLHQLSAIFSGTIPIVIQDLYETIPEVVSDSELFYILIGDSFSLLTLKTDKDIAC